MSQSAFLIIGFYAGMCSLLIVASMIAVIRRRRRTKVAFGDGDDDTLIRLIRWHGNAIENVPMITLLMLVLGLQSVELLTLHIAGLMLLIGRICHTLHCLWETNAFTLRVAGTALTITAWVFCSLRLIYAGLSGLT